MPKYHQSEQGILTLMGMCLMCVQFAERSLELALDTVFEDSSAAQKAMLEIMEPRKPTLGHFLKELRKRVRLERGFREQLYRFLDFRNIFIHDLKKVPGGWNLKTAEGREVAYLFLGELMILAGIVQMIFLTTVNISAREECGIDISEGNLIVGMVEKHFGATARKVLAARIK